jgi:predicted metalloprotease
LAAALIVMFSAYDGGGAFAVEGTNEADFVEAVVSSVNAYWGGEFGSLGYPYSPAKLVFVYDELVGSGCGPIIPYDGPAYCAIDETFYYPVNWTVPGGQALEQYGYSAVAMGVAHEIGHHAQRQMDNFGLRDLEKWTLLQHELQADCFAGMWSRQAGEQFGAGGIEAILDALVDLSAPTHGTPEQRIASFGVGYQTGDLAQCLAQDGINSA